MTIKEVNEAAKREGMTYGQYVDKYDPQGEIASINPAYIGVCAFCGREFIKATKHKRIYCSDQCRIDASNAKRNDKKAYQEVQEEMTVELPVSAEETTEHDVVNHPSHYTQGDIECKDAIRAAVTGLGGFEGFLTGNAIKYLWRWKWKNGTEDLRKAVFWIERLIEEQEGEIHAEKECIPGEAAGTD